MRQQIDLIDLFTMFQHKLMNFYYHFMSQNSQFCILYCILPKSSKIDIMGHTASCMTNNQQVVKHHSITKDDSDTRKKINPLKYIQPINFYSEDLTATCDLDSRQNQVLEDKQNIYSQDISKEQEFNKTLEFRQRSLALKTQKTITQTQHDIVKVRWDKFIKMKKRNFSDDYRIINEIGRGGFGCVYKVAMKNTDIYRAAKKINKEKLKKDEHENLLAEMAIMMSLDHPNIIKLFEVYDQKGYYIMVLELCQGGELFQKIVNQTIKQSEAKTIMRQVLSALHYLHEKGIVHRDIKPQNMLVESTTSLVKIIDFGISTRINPGQNLISRVGTPYYIAPEVLHRNYNEKCDVWSVGVVLYMIVYNYPPFKGQDAIKVMESVLKDEISYKTVNRLKFSNQGSQFMKKLLNRDVSKRPSAKEALKFKWLEYNKRSESTVILNQEKQQVLQRITAFHFKNKLQAVVHTFIVSQLLTSQERLQLLGVFRQLDQNNNGIIDSEQIKCALQSRKFSQIKPKKVQKIIDYIDTNCSGHIDYTQFLVAAIDFDKKINQKHLQQAFAYFDIDNSGEITFEEVAKFLQNQVSSEQVKKMFLSVDKNGDGVISKVEFVELLLDHKNISNNDI